MIIVQEFFRDLPAELRPAMMRALVFSTMMSEVGMAWVMPFRQCQQEVWIDPQWFKFIDADGFQ